MASSSRSPCQVGSPAPIPITSAETQRSRPARAFSASAIAAAAKLHLIRVLPTRHAWFQLSSGRLCCAEPTASLATSTTSTGSRSSDVVQRAATARARARPGLATCLPRPSQSSGARPGPGPASWSLCGSNSVWRCVGERIEPPTYQPRSVDGVLPCRADRAAALRGPMRWSRQRPRVPATGCGSSSNPSSNWLAQRRHSVLSHLASVRPGPRCRCCRATPSNHTPAVSGRFS